MLRTTIVRHLTQTYYDFERANDAPDWLPTGTDGEEILHLVHWWSCDAQDDVAMCFLKLTSRAHQLRFDLDLTTAPHHPLTTPLYAASCTVGSWREYRDRFVNGIMHTTTAIVDAICDDLDDMHSGEETTEEH